MLLGSLTTPIYAQVIQITLTICFVVAQHKNKQIWRKFSKRLQADPTTAEEDSFSISHCKEVSSDSCVESCTEKRLKDPMSRKPYAVGPLGEDCQEYSERMLEECKSSCRSKRKNWNFL